MKVILTICLIVLAGCQFDTSPPRSPMRWAHRKHNNASQFFADRYECIKDASNQSASFSAGSVAVGELAVTQGTSNSKRTVSHDLYVSCMYSRGYYLHPEGEFFTPLGAEVKLEW